FYNGFVNPFLNFSGFDDAAGKLTLGQATEVAIMIALPWLLVRFGIKALFIGGAAAWAIRFAMFAAAGEAATAWLAYPAILLHGASFVFIYMTGQLYIDRLADRDARAAAQGIHTVSIFGFGNLIGALAARAAEVRYLTPEGIEPPPYDWPAFWMVAAAMSAAGAVLFALLFHEQRR
ncbi:MAG: MFS transporter, partial [Planctomycetota bacterium]